MAFANWMIDSHNNPQAPLGSVELLVSGGHFRRTDGTTSPVDDPAFEACRTAAKAWNGRLQQPDDVAVFYCCGHGLQPNAVKTTLLASDFANPAEGDWENAIDFDHTLLAMNASRSQRQVYILDACRNVADQAQNYTDVKPRALVTLSRPSASKAQDLLILSAAMAGHTAHADPGATVSWLTTDLIAALNDSAAWSTVRGGFAVTTSSLKDEVSRLMRCRVQPNGDPAYCDPKHQANLSITRLHITKQPPLVTATVDCFPDSELEHAELHARPKTAGLTGSSRPPTPRPWKVDLRAGLYDFEARFASGRPSGVESNVIVFPPDPECTITV